MAQYIEIISSSVVCSCRLYHYLVSQIEVFINSLQYKNDNIANFVLALPLKINSINEDCSFKKEVSKTHYYLFHIC